MTIQELEQKLNECQKALAELKESKKEGKWKPKNGDAYWFRDSFGNNIGETSTDCHIDRWRSNHMIIFPTKEECERYWHFMDAVKKKSYEFTELEWKNSGIAKYEIYYHYHDYTWRIATEYHCRAFGTTYFKSREDAQYIIDNFKDELMEYWI
jgi:hypothetical protein